MRDEKKKKRHQRKHGGSNFKWVDEQKENRKFFVCLKASGLWFLAGRGLYLHPCFCFHPFASQVPKFEHGETPNGEVEE